MKLLITTQKVDANDSDLGFFVRWIEEFKKHCEVEIISLPMLGSGGKISRAWQLLRLALKLKYDAVFVHMNPEYLVTVGWFWRLKGKKSVLWYTHKSVNLKLRVATFFANAAATASKESFRLKSNKVHILGHGIDTDFFTPDPTIVREDVWLSAGRLNKSKRHDLAIRAAAEAGKPLRIFGEGPERAALEALARELGANVTFMGGLNQTGVRNEFRRASLFLHMSETGSLDKVILEAIACGCPVRTRDPALKFLEHEGPEYVQREHSLKNLIPKIIALYTV